MYQFLFIKSNDSLVAGVCVCSFLSKTTDLVEKVKRVSKENFNLSFQILTPYKSDGRGVLGVPMEYKGYPGNAPLGGGGLT